MLAPGAPIAALQELPTGWVGWQLQNRGKKKTKLPRPLESPSCAALPASAFVLSGELGSSRLRLRCDKAATSLRKSPKDLFNSLVDIRLRVFDDVLIASSFEMSRERTMKIVCPLRF